MDFPGRADQLVAEVEVDLLIRRPELRDHPIELRDDLRDPPWSAIRLGGKIDAGLIAHALEGRVVDVAVEVGDGLLEVGVELRGVGGGAHFATGHHRQPGEKIITAACLELLAHLRRPTRFARFVAVEVQVGQARVADQVAEVFADLADHVLHVELNGFWIHFVAFVPHGRPLRGLDLFALGRVAEAEDFPLARRCFPIEIALGIHHLGEIDRRVLAHRALGGHREHRDVAVEDLAVFNDRGSDFAGLRDDHGKHLVGARIDGRARQGDLGPLSALDADLGRNDLLHRKLGRDPLAAAGFVAGTISHAEIQPEALRLRGGMADELPPGVGEGDDIRLRAVADLRLPRRANIRECEHHRTAETRVFQCLQIGRDALLRHITAHPHPHHAGLRLLRRVCESLVK